VDGIIGKGTFAQLNTTLAERVEQIQLSLERMRWLPAGLDDATTYIVVNIAGFNMFAMRGGRDHTLDMNVIVGEQFPDRQTPVFAGRMAYIEFSPYWNVPSSIAKRDLIPAIVKDPTELGKRHLEMVRDFSPNALPQEPTAENIQRLQRGALLLRQKPGPHNALGPAKFIFPNSHSVYLHGTPAQGLFARSQRTFSSGCVRVEDPAALAEFLLRGDQAWDEARIEKAMHADSPTRVQLQDPTWVFILYATAWVSDNGVMNFREDIYGHDARLAEELVQGYPYPW
jgi:murein L,D-transpeptidase YcbB/YkuD